MNERQLFRALGDVDDSLLEAAERLPHRKKPRHTGLWIAACLCLAALSLAAPYVALFTKGASSADPKAAVSTQGAPSATEAAPRASSDRRLHPRIRPRNPGNCPSHPSKHSLHGPLTEL